MPSLKRFHRYPKVYHTILEEVKRCGAVSIRLSTPQAVENLRRDLYNFRIVMKEHEPELAKAADKMVFRVRGDVLHITDTDEMFYKILSQSIGEMT